VALRGEICFPYFPAIPLTLIFPLSARSALLYFRIFSQNSFTVSAKSTSPIAAMPATSQRIALPIEGMTCASCVARVERALKKVAGVADVSVNLATETATIVVDDSTQATRASLVAAVIHAGYGVPEMPEEAKPKLAIPRESSHTNAPNTSQNGEFGKSVTLQAPSSQRRLGSSPSQHLSEGARVIIALALAAPLVLPMLVMPFGRDWMLPGWWQFALALPVQVWLGARFYRAGWHAVKAGTGNMDLLVAIGTTAAFGLSLYLLLTSPPGSAPHLYFESAAVVIALVMLGKWLESLAKHEATDAIRALAALAPSTVLRVERYEVVREVPLRDVQVGDTLRVRPGERIGADGVVRVGRTHVNESMLTGESTAALKEVGSRVTGGALNMEGAIDFVVDAVGETTMLARISRMVEDAQGAKAPIQRLVDRVAAVFVPVVLIVALVTLLAWGLATHDWSRAILNAVAVLVIACPCALGLATPAAIMVGTGVAARHGILIKDAVALETARRISVVAFDKTGTLTEGKPQLTRTIVLRSGVTEQQVLAIAAALQANSEHPLAPAVMNAARAQSIVIGRALNSRAVPGRGIEGDNGGKRYRLGSERWMRELNVDVTLESYSHPQTSGESVAWLADELGAVAVFAFADQIKPEAKAALAALHAQGIRTALISGDNVAAAQRVATELGIDEVHAEVLPDQKAQLVTSLRKSAVVAMVGDGVNDAPALAAADVAFAMSGGTDVAMETAAITLMRGDLMLVARAIEVSRRTTTKIHQNLFWAFGYNVVGIPLAALGFLNPIIAGLAMALSSVSVITNALLLKRFDPR
jgi:P-type Cu+ transporter